MRAQQAQRIADASGLSYLAAETDPNYCRCCGYRYSEFDMDESGLCITGPDGDPSCLSRFERAERDLPDEDDVEAFLSGHSHSYQRYHVPR